MCGIVGIVSKKETIKYEKRVKQALDSLSHRGPDDKRWYKDNHICFGYVRLAIRGLSEKYNQPIITDDTISFANGEVYSIKGKEVSKEYNDLLPLIGEITKNREQIYDYIDADFALCTFNKKKNTFILARDFYGVKPLFYSWLDKETLAFASEIKSLQMLIGKEKTYDVETIKDYLIFGYPVGNKTFFKNIFRLPPKTIFEWNIDTNKKSYYQGNNKYINYTYNHSNAYEAIKEAVVNRLISNRNIGAHLSGGYDSSLIAYISGQKLDYITAYNSVEDNDLKISNEVSDDMKLNHTIIKLPQLINYSEMIDILSSPIMSSGVFVPYEVAKVSSMYNKKVLLEGQGADELFLGYSRFKDIKKVSTKEQLIESLSNSDINMLNNLFSTDNITEKYVKSIKSNELLAEGHKFYIDNFLSEILYIEDAMHMHFSIENRVPYLSLPVRKFITKNGIYIGDNTIKDAIYNANKMIDSKSLQRDIKENMNRDLLQELKNTDLEVIFKHKAFANLNYKELRRIIENIDQLKKKQLYLIWAIYNVHLWFEKNNFNERIVVN